MFNFLTYKFEDLFPKYTDMLVYLNENKDYLEIDIANIDAVVRTDMGKRFYNFCALRYHGATIAYNNLNDFHAKFLHLINFNFNEINKNYTLEQKLYKSDIKEFTHGDLVISEITNSMNTVIPRVNARELTADNVHSTQTRDQVIRSEARAIIDFLENAKPFDLNEFFSNRRAGISFDDLFIKYIPFVPTFFEKEVN